MNTDQGTIAPVDNEPGDLDAEAREDDGETAEADNKLEELADKYEDPEKSVHEHLKDGTKTGARDPPIVKLPPSMTREEWDRHKVTHTPYAPGCRHRVAARATRRQHPKKRKHSIIVPDIDGSCI